MDTFEKERESKPIVSNKSKGKSRKQNKTVLKPSNYIQHMVSAFEGNPRNDPPSLIDCVDGICDDKTDRDEMIEALNGRLYD